MVEKVTYQPYEFIMRLHFLHLSSDQGRTTLASATGFSAQSNTTVLLVMAQKPVSSGLSAS